MHARLAAWFRYEQPHADGRLRVHGRRIYILPTRYGLVFGLLLILILIGAVNYGNNPAFLLTFLLAGLGANAIHQTWRNLLDLTVRPLSAEPVFAGEPARFRFQISDQAGRPRPALQLAFAEHEPQVLDLPAYGSAAVELSLPSRRRGSLAAPRLVLATRYPLGLLHVWCYLESGAQCLVYPRPSGPWQPAGSPRFGSAETGDRGVGADDFVGLRGYRPGDSPRHIDWRALARERGVLTRQFGGDRAETLWLDWEQTPGRDPEERLRRLCRALLDAERAGARYGLRLPGAERAPQQGKAHLAACLTLLAQFPGAAAEAE
ncbi:MAG: hypothetical protein RLZ44_701 [Pseudomonadota bacterium]|jgi:uncharacterized protein (DUF58 family)